MVGGAPILVEGVTLVRMGGVALVRMGGVALGIVVGVSFVVVGLKSSWVSVTEVPS